MIASNIIAAAIAAANAAAEAAPLGAAAVKAGSAVLDLVNGLRGIAGATPEHIAEFEASREALERAVNDHASRTAASLGDPI